MVYLRGNYVQSGEYVENSMDLTVVNVNDYVPLFSRKGIEWRYRGFS